MRLPMMNQLFAPLKKTVFLLVLILSSFGVNANWTSFTGTVNGYVLTWNDLGGWTQVQDISDLSNVTNVAGCEGTISSCTVPSVGTYKVIDHDHNRIWDNIQVTGSGGNSSIAIAHQCPDDTIPCVMSGVNSYFNLQSASIVHEDDFNGATLDTSKWHRERPLANKNLHQKPGVSAYQDKNYVDIDGRRDPSFSDEYETETGFVDSGLLIQRGIREQEQNVAIIDPDRDLAYYDPRVDGINNGSKATLAATPNINYGDKKLFSSFLASVSYPNDYGRVPRSNLHLAGSTELISFGPGTFFEIEISFEKISTVGHRH